MKKNLYIMALAIGLIFTVVTSCKDQLEEATTNPNELSTETYFKTEAEALQPSMQYMPHCNIQICTNGFTSS
jgi:hypothetical protein